MDPLFENCCEESIFISLLKITFQPCKLAILEYFEEKTLQSQKRAPQEEHRNYYKYRLSNSFYVSSFIG
jgi:hypothetical protein